MVIIVALSTKHNNYDQRLPDEQPTNQQTKKLSLLYSRWCFVVCSCCVTVITAMVVVLLFVVVVTVMMTIVVVLLFVAVAVALVFVIGAHESDFSLVKNENKKHQVRRQKTTAY